MKNRTKMVRMFDIQGVAERNSAGCGSGYGFPSRGLVIWGFGRKVYIRLPAKGTSNSHGARPVHQLNSMIMWIRTSRLS